jgi:alpha-D-xyloside xylohydrolase
MFTSDPQRSRLYFRANNQCLCLEPWGRDSLRVRAVIGDKILEPLPNALLEVGFSKAEITLSDEEARIQQGDLTAVVSKRGLIRFERSDTGEELLAEEVPHLTFPHPRTFKPVASNAYQLEARFRAYNDERLYGLGQHQHGKLDQKGCVLDLEQRNTEVSIPFMVSSRGYGFLWNNPALGRVELGQNRTRWTSDTTKQLDYWICAGNSYATIMQRYLEVTGFPPPMPQWALGFWQSNLRYPDEETLLAVAHEHKRRGLPLSVIVIDYFHWTKHGEWRFDSKHWPDPKGLVDTLTALGVKAAISVWPTVNPQSEHFELMKKRGWLVRSEHGVAAFTLFADTGVENVYLHLYDATHPEARQFLWEQLSKGYVQHGIKLWWLDACEPEAIPQEVGNMRFHLGSGLEVGNLYPLLHAQALYEGMMQAGETEILSMCRSAWAGSQRYGAAVWSGDIPSTFEALQAQLPAGLNMALSGIYWWNTDIGGYHSGNPSTMYFRELVVRWFQYGIFTPICRLHGHRIPDDPTMFRVGATNEIWNFGDEAYSIIRELLFLRERLRPYLMEQMNLAHTRGIPPMRPLFFDFPDDPLARGITDQFLCGPDILVAPVLFEGARRRQVYLPAGCRWLEVGSNKILEGGQHLCADAPLNKIPVYVREGAELPFHPQEAR